MTVARQASGIYPQAGGTRPNQADALQALYFPTLRSELTAMEGALMPLIDWLETQWDHQGRDFQGWRAQFDPEEGKPLYNAYATACNETIEAVVRAVPQSRTFARALARPRKH
jgi:hypothetical protein